MFLIITVVLSSLGELKFPSSDSLKRNRDSLLFPFQPFLLDCCFDDDAPDEVGDALFFPLPPEPILVAAAVAATVVVVALIFLFLLAPELDSASLVLLGSVGLTALPLRRIATGAFCDGTFCRVDARSRGGVGKFGL